MISKRYQISRVELARLAAEEYVRSFWWFLGITPLFGIVALVTTTGLLQVIGWFAILWPFSIPARAVISSSRAGKLFAKGTWFKLEDGVLYFHGDDGKGMKLTLRGVRDAVMRGEFLVLRTRRYGIVPIPVGAVSQDELRYLLESVGKARAIPL